MSYTEQVQSLERTAEKFTAGIVNIPLTKPAFIYFNKQKEDVKTTTDVLDSLNLNYNIEYKTNHDGKGVFHIRTTEQVESNVIKNLWRNFKSIRPHIDTQYRYLFWEIDTRDMDVFAEVIAVYRKLQLPIVFHPSMRGFHFMSVKPLDKQVWKDAIKELRFTNLEYPPLTLRIKPNKYLGEVTEFNQARVISTSYHADSTELAKWIHTQQIAKISHKYYVVWYRFPDTIQGVQQGQC